MELLLFKNGIGIRRMYKGLAALFLFLFLTSLVFAGDGQIDIRPTGAATFTISTPGSYILTDNVTMTADVHCIQISVDDVTLDLNGHTITGNGSAYTGIYGSGADRVHIFNGTVRNFGKYGIHLGDDCRVRDIFVRMNSQTGILVGDGCHILRVTAISNAYHGINTGQECLVEDCVARLNASAGGKAGIYVSHRSTIKNCIAAENSNTTNNTDVNNYGIYGGTGSTIINNTCYKNENSTTFNGGKACGIYAGSGCTVINNTCHNNNATNEGTEAVGILSGSVSTVMGNTCYDNNANGSGGISKGIHCSGSCTIKNNTCSENSVTGENSTSYGILAYQRCTIQGNTCSNNSATGTTTATGVGIEAHENCYIFENNCHYNCGTLSSYGIYLKHGYCRVERNRCSHHSQGTNRAGILLSDLSADCIVTGNTTTNNINGIDLGGKDAYCAENIHTDALINVSSATLGTGDRSNISF